MNEKCCGEILLWSEIKTATTLKQSQCRVCCRCHVLKNEKFHYVQKFGSSEMVCSECGNDILVMDVVHPVHENVESLSGRGKTVREDVPYCGKCEEVPKRSGCPVTEDFNL